MKGVSWRSLVQAQPWQVVTSFRTYLRRTAEVLHVCNPHDSPTHNTHHVLKTCNSLGKLLLFLESTGRTLTLSQACRAATRAATPASRPFAPTRFITPFQARYLSDAVRSAIDKAVASAPVVLFMKGTPDLPSCGFSRASIQILGMQGVDPEKFTAFNVLEDQELRAGTSDDGLRR